MKVLNTRQEGNLSRCLNNKLIRFATVAFTYESSPLRHPTGNDYNHRCIGKMLTQKRMGIPVTDRSLLRTIDNQLMSSKLIIFE